MIFLPIALILFILGWLIKVKKVTWLISGFNTASKSKQEEYDIDKLCKYFGNFLYVLAYHYLFWGIVLLLLSQFTDLIIWSAFISSFFVVVGGIIFLNTGNKLKK